MSRERAADTTSKGDRSEGREGGGRASGRRTGCIIASATGCLNSALPSTAAACPIFFEGVDAPRLVLLDEMLVQLVEEGSLALRRRPVGEVVELRGVVELVHVQRPLRRVSGGGPRERRGGLGRLRRNQGSARRGDEGAGQRHDASGHAGQRRQPRHDRGHHGLRGGRGRARALWGHLAGRPYLASRVPAPRSVPDRRPRPREAALTKPHTRSLRAPPQALARTHTHGTPQYGASADCVSTQSLTFTR